LAGKIAGLLNLLRPAHASLEETGGRVVALTAPTAFEPEPAMGAVSAARAALDNVVRCLAFDLAPRGIRINAVGVGLIDTPRQQDRFAAAAGNGGDYQEWLAP
jgi:NAD(P)-dependent dehydrogenase (short-subunit alcohol dehydrogenase family)